MNWFNHSQLEGKHAILGASKHHWVNYSEEKMIDAYKKQEMVRKGTELHELAAKLITNGIRLPKIKTSLNQYVNDAIGYKMRPEQILYYSDNCFGTADAISFRNDQLRIHDLKTGVSAASMNQLMIYAALFCLEYRKDPSKLDIVLRIYQNGDVTEEIPNPDDIHYIMDKIKKFDEIIEGLKTEG